MVTDRSSRFGSLLRRHRKAAGLTQEELAEKARLSARAISDLERGLYQSPHRDTVALLAAALRLSDADRAALEAAARRPISTEEPASMTPPPPAYPFNLPVMPTTLIGREREIEAVTRLLCDGARLLTLTGPAGVGKTRVALQAATDARDHYADGVVFVALAPIRDPSLVVSAIAQALDVRESGEQTLAESVIAALRDRRVLLLLDNFEQVTDATPLLADLLAACPRLALLVTSQAALRLQAEQQQPIQPLTIPNLVDLPAIDALEQSPAMQLFAQRARAVAPDFALTVANAAPVAAICRRLDGLPLAIELAAARVTLLPPAALLARLEGGYSNTTLLSSGARDLPARQRTLRGALTWSYDLLTPEEQALFRRLSVFVGGCTLNAAEAVCVEPDNVAIDILGGLASLIDKSLLRPVDQQDAEPRQRMLETVREYALDLLEESGEAAELRARHAAHYLARAEEAEPELTGPEQAAWLDRLEREHNNLRAALRRSRDGGEVEVGLRLAAALWRFWWRRGYLTEGREWLEGLLAVVSLENKSGAIAIHRATHARALNGAGMLAYVQDDHKQATTFFEHSLVLRRGLGDTQGVAKSLNNLGNIALDQGDYEHASALYEESLILKRGLGDVGGIATTLANLGQVANDQGEYMRAMALLEESLALSKALGDTYGIAASLQNLGDVALQQGDARRAMALTQESLALWKTLDDTHELAVVFSRLGNIARSQGALEQARALYSESLILLRRIGDKRAMADCLEGVAGVAAAQAQPLRAARLFGAAAGLREAIGAPLPPGKQSAYGQDTATVSGALGDGTAAAWAAGRAVPLDRAIDEALGAEAV
ncbi:MAG: tetratricopeptide repeat protein [Chloroflexota bacterium]|nr:tetratricopeptide repeat protein [Chloroflexota bacterium]